MEFCKIHHSLKPNYMNSTPTTFTSSVDEMYNKTKQASAISYQLSAISYQLSAISYQLSAISLNFLRQERSEMFLSNMIIDI
jgi:hypothetical protein